MGLRGRSRKKTARIQPIIPQVTRIYRWYVLNKKVGFEVTNEKFEPGNQVDIKDYPIAGYQTQEDFMFKFFIDQKAQDHEEGCSFMPDPENSIYLVNFYFCREAVRESKIHFSQTNGCYYCSNECHAGSNENISNLHHAV